MRRTMVVLLSSLAVLAPTVAMAANQAVAVDAKVLSNAKVERNGKQVGTVQRVMVDPTSGRIEHLDILMNEGQQRLIAVPWSGVSLFQNSGGNMTVSLTSRAASEASPSASPNLAASAPEPTNDVAVAQSRLKDRGYYSGPIDGVLGPNTQAALRAYQRDKGLSVTATLDAPTRGALMSDTGTAAARTVPSWATTMDVRSAQKELKERGYYSGPIDGVIGAATQSALRAYQRDRGLKVTGRLDSSTIRSLTS